MWTTEQARPMATKPPPLPPHHGGGRWQIFAQRDWDLYWADTWSDVLDALVHSDSQAEGSAAEDLAQMADAVSALLDAVVTTTQARINYEAQSEKTPVPDDEWAVLRSPKFPHPVVERWDSSVPLVLLTQEYEPYKETPRPEGNILWVESLHTAEPEAVVRSLAAIGYLSVEDISAIAP